MAGSVGEITMRYFDKRLKVPQRGKDELLEMSNWFFWGLLTGLVVGNFLALALQAVHV
jgi:hypothetical protein